MSQHYEAKTTTESTANQEVLIQQELAEIDAPTAIQALPTVSQGTPQDVTSRNKASPLINEATPQDVNILNQEPPVISQVTQIMNEATLNQEPVLTQELNNTKPEAFCPQDPPSNNVAPPTIMQALPTTNQNEATYPAPPILSAPTTNQNEDYNQSSVLDDSDDLFNILGYSGRGKFKF